MTDKYRRQLPTLEDVARRAGVSRSLVSLALRGQEGVSDKNRRKIQRAAVDLGYKPNVLARNLASTATRTIGIIVGDILNPFQALLAREADAAARDLGYEVLLSINGTTDEAVLASLEELRAHRVAGLILVGAPRDRAAIRAIGSGLPTVYVAQHLSAFGVDSVSNDDFQGAAIVVEYLVSLGHRRIAYIDGGNEAGAALRSSGYAETMLRLGLSPWVVPGNHTLEAGDLGTLQILKADSKPTAIFAANDLCALGVLSRLAQSHVGVPEDMTVVGFDNLPIADTAMVSLTTVRQPVSAIAARSLHALTRRMSDPVVTAEHVMISPDLIVRRSSAPPRRDE
jgi:DNA-binding LacI/PurR family transcriptional regulator